MNEIGLPDDNGRPLEPVEIAAHVPDTQPSDMGAPQVVIPRAASQRLASEQVVIAAPMSFAGSAQRIWKLTRMSSSTPAVIALGTLAVTMIGLAWVLVACWYVLTFVLLGVIFIPYRLLRRGSRKRKRQALQHREQLAAMDSVTRAVRDRR